MTINNDSGIEPLSDISWQRIERGIFAELDEHVVARAEPAHRSWRPMWAVVAFTAAAAAVLLFVILGRDSSTGMSSDNSAGSSATRSRIATEDSPAKITLGRATLIVAPHSALWVNNGNQQDATVILEQGSVDCAVEHLDSLPFVVQAGDVRIEVVGTRFSVFREGFSARVAVARGKVMVFHDGERSMVGAGQSWPSAAIKPLPSSAPGEPGAPSNRAREAGVGQPGQLAQAGEPGQPGTTSEASLAVEQPAVARPERRAVPGKPAAAAGPSRQEQYESAAGLEARDPAAASAIYRQLARGKDAWAANALYARARLELELGHRPLAMRLLRDYLRRFPRGANAIDARELASTLE